MTSTHEYHFEVIAKVGPKPDLRAIAENRLLSTHKFLPKLTIEKRKMAWELKIDENGTWEKPDDFRTFDCKILTIPFKLKFK